MLPMRRSNLFFSRRPHLHRRLDYFINNIEKMNKRHYPLKLQLLIGTSFKGFSSGKTNLNKMVKKIMRMEAFYKISLLSLNKRIWRW